MTSRPSQFSLQKAGLWAVSLSLGWLGLSTGIEWLLPRVMDFEALERQMTQQVQEATGLHLSIDTLSIRPTLFHGLRVGLRGVTLRDSHDAMMGQARRVEVYLRYLPLLSQQGAISQVAIQRPNVLLGKDSAWLHLKVPHTEKKQLFLDNAKLGAYHVRVVTNFIPGAQNTPALLTGKAFEIDHWASPYPVTAFAKGTVWVGNAEHATPLSDFLIRGKIRQAAFTAQTLEWDNLMEAHVGLHKTNLTEISQIFSDDLPFKVTGKAEQLLLTLHHPSGYAQLQVEGKTSIPITVHASGHRVWLFPVQALVQGTLPGNPLQGDWRVQNLLARVESKPLAFTLDGDLNLQPKTKSPEFKGHLQLKKLALPALSAVTAWPQPWGQWLKQSQGQLGGQFTLAGPVSHPLVLGSLDLDGVGLRDPKTQRLMVESLDGVLLHPTASDWEAGELSGKLAGGPFLLHGRYQSNTQNVLGRLQFNRIQLPLVQGLVGWLSPSTPFVSQVNAAGQADGFLEAQGTLKKPNLKGWVAIHKGFLALAQDKTPLLDNLEGRIRLDNQSVYAEPLLVTVGQAPIKFLGGGTAKHLQLGVEAHQVPLALVQKRLLAWQTLLGAYWPMLSDWRVQEGTFSSDLTVESSLQTPRLGGSAQITGLQILHGPTTLTLSNGKATFQAGPKDIHLVDTHAVVEGVPVSVTGELSADWQHLRAMAETPVFEMNTLAPVFKKLIAQVDPALSLQGRGQFQGFAKGSLHQPDWRGTLRLTDVGAQYPSKKLILTGLNGQLIASPKGVEASGLSGVLNTLKFALQGQSAFNAKTYDVRLISQDAALTALRDTLLNVVPTSQKALTQVGLQTGTANVDIHLTSTAPLKPAGHITLKNITAHPSGLGMGLALPLMEYDLASGQFTLPGRGLQIGDLWFKLSGFANSQGYRVHLASERVPVAMIRDNLDLLTRVTQIRWPQLYNAEGEFQLTADMAPGAHKASVQFWKAGASMAGVKYPVYDINGALHLSLDKGLQASADNLAFRVANSPIRLNLDINTLNDIYVDASGVLSPLMVNDLLLDKGLMAVANVAMPFTLNASGSLASFSGAGTGNNLNLFVNFDIASLFNNPELVHPSVVHIKNKALDNATLSSVVHLLGNVLQIEETRLKVGDQSGVQLSGEIKNLFTPDQRSVSLKAQTTPQLNLAELGQAWNDAIASGLAGLVTGDLQYVATPSSNDLTGKVVFNHVSSTPLAIDDLDGQVAFLGQTGQLTVNHFVIPGVDVAFTAQLSQLFQYPLPLSEFNLTGNQFIVTLYSDWMNQIFTTKIRQGFWEQFFPNTGRMGPLPFEITDGMLAIKEGVLNNLIIEDYTSTVRLYPNNYFELDHIQGRSAGGNAQGFYAMSPRDNNFMTVQMHLDRMKANAVARILLNVSNQIFGDLSGDIAYTTEGITNEEMLSHTNGSATLWIEDGRLPQIAKIENLLVAANTFSGGLANLNLNSLFRLASPFNTNYFAKLTGNFKMVEGIIYTNDMKSDGRNLDLYFKGLVHMDTGIADMVLRGEMDRDIQGTLGPLGQLSFGRFIGLIPPLRMIISHIPGLGFVPGFGGPKTHKGVAFEAKIEGPAVDPGSVKSFKWVK